MLPEAKHVVKAAPFRQATEAMVQQLANLYLGGSPEAVRHGKQIIYGNHGKTTMMMMMVKKSWNIIYEWRSSMRCSMEIQHF